METKDLFEFEYVPGSPDMIQAIKCKLCGQPIAQPDLDKGDLKMVPVSITAHFGIQHDIDISFHHCNDPKCLEP